MKITLVAATVLLSVAGGASPAAPDYKEGEVNVKYAFGSYLAPYATPVQLGASVLAEDKTIGWYTLKLPASMTTAGAVKQLHGMPGVQYAEPNYYRHPSYTPDDLQYGSQYGPQKIGCPAGWNFGLGVPTVTIAFIDTGIDTAHPEFAGRIRILNGCNIVDQNSDPTDIDGHGTHTAGIAAAATDNLVGIAGICQASILPVRVFDGNNGGTVSIVSKGYEFAANNGADIINASLGGPDYSQQESDAVTYAISHGSIFVAAAGNSGSTTKQYPAAYTGVVSVGASDPKDARASYSEYGPWVSVAAPGDKILSTWTGESYAYQSGTSMAAPHVAGALALLKSFAPGSVDSSAIRDALLSTTDPIGSWVHYGRINVSSALNLLAEETTGLVTIFPSDASRYEGNLTGGGLASLHAVDGNTYNVQSISPTPGIQAGSAQFSFLLATTPAKVSSAVFNFTAFGTNNGTSMLYLYNWLKKRYDFVKGIAMTAAGNSIHIVSLPSNLAPYVHDGQLLALLRGYLAAQANGGSDPQFTYQIDLASLTLTLAHGP